MINWVVPSSQWMPFHPGWQPWSQTPSTLLQPVHVLLHLVMQPSPKYPSGQAIKQTQTIFFLFFFVSTIIHSKFAFVSTYVFYIDPRYIQDCNQLSMSHLLRDNRLHNGNDHMCQCRRIHRFGLNMLKYKY